MSTKNKLPSTRKIGRPRKEESKVYSKRVPLSMYLNIKILVDKYINNILNDKLPVNNTPNNVDKNSINVDNNYYKNGITGDLNGNINLNIYKVGFLDLFLFMLEVSKSSILRSIKNYDLWVKLLEKQGKSKIDNAVALLRKEGLIKWVI